MEIILRIYFIGLIAFVPSQDGSETTIILERARDRHQASDGHHIEPHLPLLLARGDCQGDCRDNSRRIADFIFSPPGRPNTRASLRQLDQALEGGGAWILDDVELTLDIPTVTGDAPKPLTYSLDKAGPPKSVTSALPSNSIEARDFAWIADMATIAPDAAVINPAILSSTPPQGLVAARLVLDQGTLSTYSLLEVEGDIVQVAFQPTRADKASVPPRAFGNWMAFDISLSPEACELGVGISARPFAHGEQRRMTIKPECTPGSVVEVALINLPPWYEARSESSQPSPYGPHFELFYKLAQQPPSEPSMRPVPVLATQERRLASKAIDYQRERSPLLDQLLMLPPKGLFAHAICLPVKFNPPTSDLDTK